MGIIAKGAKCNIEGCDKTGLRVSTMDKKTVLCKEHYKEWKKETKDDRSLERARYDIF